MLNFNTIDNPNAFAHSISLHGGNFSEPPTTMVTSSSANQSQSHQQQINLNYLGANPSTDQTNWTHSDAVHNTSGSTINDNCNRNTNNNLSSETGRVHEKDYLQTVIADNSGGRSTLSMGNFLQQKGSENVKRFSVNNLLQLANNCRTLADEHRLSVGE